MFFVTGHGRSGTVFLSDLLAKSKNGHVFHESAFLDQDLFVEAFRGRTELSSDRLKLIETRQRQQPNLIYGEVNGYLRYWAPFLLTLTPDVFHLVRNGKDVIRSMFNRNAISFTKRDKNRTRFIYPTGDDPYTEKWEEMPRFERLCWYWQHGVAKLLSENIPVIQFEQVLKSYEYLQDHLLTPTGLELNFDVWEYERRILKNETIIQKAIFPKYEGWSERQKQSFISICGESMEACGYVI